MSKQHKIIGVVLVWIMSTIATPHLVEANQQRDDTYWANWCQYLFRYPDYQKHQEPADIATNGCRWGTWVTFPNKIMAIEAKVGPWERPEELFRSLDFIAMYRYPSHYQKHCLAYLAGSRPTEQQKQIAIYAMECLPGYINFAQACYQLYKQKQLSEALFQLVLSFELVRVHPCVIPSYYSEEIHTFLQQVQTELGADTPIGLQIEEILSGRLAKAWEQKGPSPYLHYINAWNLRASTEETYQEFIEILGQAAKDWEAFMYCPWEPVPHSHPPYFLMMLEHPGYYLSLGNPNNITFLRCLQDPNRTNLERRLFILAMQQLESYGRYGGQVDTAYRNLIESACWCYRGGNLPLPLLEGLLVCPFYYPSNNYPQYPLCIVDYKKPAMLHYVLDEFIALPTIPCGLKEMAKKIQAGKLAAAREMKYLEGYREFRKTHFILYETIEPSKE